MHELANPRAAVDWLRSRVTGDLQVDSRKICAGDGFIAWPGATTDGRRYVQDALSRGAAACLVEREGVGGFRFDGGAIACVAGLKAGTGPIAAAWYGEPTERLNLLAVTGTNGKTSTVWWLAQALSRLSEDQRVPTAMVGTLGVGLPPGSGAGALSTTGLTTPDPVTMQRWFARFVNEGIAACAIEASSIGLAEGRLAGSRIRLAMFTNFSQDHLDYHGSMEAYWRAKTALFGWPGLQTAVINIDDAHGAKLAASLASSTLDVWTYSARAPARLFATGIESSANGLVFSVNEGVQTCSVKTPLIGRYNVSNLLGVIAAMRSLCVSLEAAAVACESVEPVPGRLERVSDLAGPLVVVDYAHTPDALEQVLGALMPLARGREGRLCCVFGCGGDRDPTKRAPMAAAAEGGADEVVVTSDNPRAEDADVIVRQIVAGLKQPESVTIQPDRARAIADAIARAADADVICIAGKGHEAYQEIGGVRHPFSDALHAANALAKRSGTSNGAAVAGREHA